MERKLDIFKVLTAADNKQVSFYKTLDEEQRKGFLPFLVGRWMSGTFNPGQVYLINEFFNPYAFSLTNHKELLWHLLTVCNSGKTQRYAWNKLPAKRETGKPNTIKAIQQYFGYSTKDAVNALDVLKREDIITIAQALGWQAEEITKIRRELKVEKEATSQKSSMEPANPLEDLLEF